MKKEKSAVFRSQTSHRRVFALFHCTATCGLQVSYTGVMIDSTLKCGRCGEFKSPDRMMPDAEAGKGVRCKKIWLCATRAEILRVERAKRKRVQEYKSYAAGRGIPDLHAKPRRTRKRNVRRDASNGSS